MIVSPKLGVNPVVSLVLAFSFFFSSTVAGQWNGGVEGGSVIREGQSAQRVRAYLSENERPLSHYLYLQWYRAETNGIELGYKPKYWLTERVYGFGDGRVRFEKELGIERESQLVGGAGIELIASDTRQLWFEAGLGYRLTRYTSETLVEDANEPVGLVRGRGVQVLSDLFKLELDGNIFASPTYIQSLLEVGVSMRLAQGAMKLSHQIRRVSIDGLDTVNDSVSGVSFTVGF